MLSSQAQKTYLLVLLLFLLPSLFGELQAQTTDAAVKTEIRDFFIPPSLANCDNATLVCKASPVDAVIWWAYQDHNVSTDNRHIISNSLDNELAVSTLTISCVGIQDIGNYSCHLGNALNENIMQTKFLNVQVKPDVIGGEDQRVESAQTATLQCTVTGYPVTEVRWKKEGNEDHEDMGRINIDKKNSTFVVSTITFKEVARKDNGTYFCTVSTPNGNFSSTVSLFVIGSPLVNIDFITAVGESRIFLNWTVNNGNFPVEYYFIQHMKNGSNSWTYEKDQVGGLNTSYVIKELSPNTAYKIKLSGRNKMGMGTSQEHKEWVQTLSKDPQFVPEISVKGVTLNSITIGWSSPPAELKNYIHCFELDLQYNDITKKALQPADMINNNYYYYLFDELHSATTYLFKVKACSEYTGECSDWSKQVNGTTMDGVSGAPQNVSVSCKFDNISRTSFVFVTWSQPAQTNGVISRYNVILEGDAKFKNERGVTEKMTWGPKIKSVNSDSESTRFDVIPPNTNYTVKVSAVTRNRLNGKEAFVKCQMPPTVPDKEKLSRFSWGKVEEQGRWMFKLYLPRISERNGPICCYRIILIKLEPQQNVADLPPPEDIVLFSYDEVHQRKKGGAYVAQMFQSDTLIHEVFLGDGKNSGTGDEMQCRSCLHLYPETTVAPPLAATTSISISENIVSSLPGIETESPLLSAVSPATPVEIAPQPLRSKRSVVSNLHMVHVQDGMLDMDSNYTGFVQIIVSGANKVLLQSYSSYFVPLKAGHPVIIADETGQVLSVVLQVLLALIFVVFVLLLALCLLQRYTKQVAEAQGVEMTLRNSFRHILCNKGYTEVELSVVCGRHLCQSLRGARHVPVSSSPPDMAPILRAEMAAAFAERHRDSDYGFQHEFELLPDRFPDRTTRGSESRENNYKNRYPDIKAYDQTRVKLSQIDGIAGSDYINANFVIGYKERKKFICAQGPMDSTVSDFWRMIWEQHLELILMLTNLEEYSKTKCAKYWPDEGEKSYGDISVTHIQEKRYSDYIIRELKMSRSCPDKEKEERSIIQYHFLVWKDFMAPEHPSGILKFIKRMNEVYSLEKGPILVHCSAGVGRTGTLVALDSLTQQIQEEGEISVFNTVCDLRHQRNFLVQNLKQYIFVYRALVELAQYGDTEHKISKLKSAVEKLKQRENGKDKSKLEEDFEKISRIPEESKSCSVASGDENRVKNRADNVIPYDRNRVILTPIPGREHSTYINASFIEGYDNSESFIITQDPLESTIPDFWRMISEQCISTLVMLSDLGDGPKKCLRYWPDDEISHGHIKVKYIQSESCPYYTRREFSVTNCKTDESITVTQFQYNGWPTVEGEVPEVTRGLIELVDQTQAHQEAQGGSGPIAVHCSHGAERSSIFVGLGILVQQIRTEKRVDIFTVTRKLRSQRQGMLQTFGQYEFLHRALVNYIDLHHLADEDT